MASPPARVAELPEGDTVHKIAGALRPALVGHRLEAIWLRERGWVEAARGRTVEDVAAVGKHLLVALGPGGEGDGYLSGVDPRTPAGRLSDAVIRGLYRDGRRLLQSNLGGWRRTTVRAVDPRHPLRPGEPRYWVYDRGGRPCLRCHAPVRSARIGDAARATFWCPRCQRDPSADAPHPTGPLTGGASARAVGRRLA